MEYISRNFVNTLLERFSEESPLIQLIIGPRQVGKTTGVLVSAAISGKILDKI